MNLLQIIIPYSGEGPGIELKSFFIFSFIFFAIFYAIRIFSFLIKKKKNKLLCGDTFFKYVIADTDIVSFFFVVITSSCILYWLIELFNTIIK